MCLFWKGLWFHHVLFWAMFYSLQLHKSKWDQPSEWPIWVLILLWHGMYTLSAHRYILGITDAVQVFRWLWNYVLICWMIWIQYWCVSLIRCQIRSHLIWNCTTPMIKRENSQVSTFESLVRIYCWKTWMKWENNPTSKDAKIWRRLALYVKIQVLYTKSEVSYTIWHDTLLTLKYLYKIWYKIWNHAKIWNRDNRTT